MTGIYRTAKGAQIDMNKLRIMNETTIAVGNTGTNARGDMVQGGKVVKSREEIAQESYNISGNNVVKQVRRIRDSENDVRPDELPTEQPQREMNLMSPMSTLREPTQAPQALPQQPNLGEDPRGGLADAVNRSAEIAARLAQQRRRI
jgi:hypothetical protein